MSAILGTQEEIAELDEKDKTVIGLLLETTDKVDAFTPSSS
jgi:hypothetical protein